MKTIYTLFTLVLWCSAASAAAPTVTSEVIGAVVLAKRTFTVDLEKCRSEWVSATASLDSSAASYCAVSLVPRKPGDIEVPGGSSARTDVYGRYTVKMDINGHGYGLYVYLRDQWDRSEPNVQTFAQAKSMLERFLREHLPEGKVTSFVHTTP